MLVILDRDGVINEDSNEYIRNPEEWIPIAGSLQAIAALNQAGHTVVIATNQSGIGRGFYTEDDLKKINEKMHHALNLVGGHIDGIFYCPHAPEAACNCRKPKPGLLLQIAKKFPTDFSHAIFIGDKESDIVCAQSMHCKAILVKTGKGVQTLTKKLDWSKISVFADLASVVKNIL